MAPPPREQAALDAILAADTSRANGDDAAIVRVPGGLACISTDVAVQGVHLAAELTPDQAGYRAAACALSDLAGMAATPIALVCALTVPEAMWSAAEAIVGGARRRADEAGAELLGGDLSSGAQLSIAVTVVGAGAGIGRHGLIERTGAHRGDGLWVTGELGAATLGLDALRTGSDIHPNRYLVPPDRLRVARILAGFASSMMDISDGLASDLRKLCDASGTGAEVTLDDLPIAAGVGGDAPAVTAATWGDDYELLFTVAPGREAEMSAAIAELDPETRVTRIGMIDVPGDVRFLLDGEQLDGLLGYEHG